MADIGYAAVFFTLLTSLYATVAYLLGRRHRMGELLASARNGIWSVAALTTIASGSLLYLLVRRDFSIRYVYEHVSTFQPTLYNLSAFWAGQEGSLLLWLWLLALLAVGVLVARGRVLQDLKPHALAVLMGSQGFFALILLLHSNPFARLPVPQQEGLGLNPLLQNFGMVIHPPVVFVGYAGFSVPFALALAALAAGRFDRQWARVVRPWLLFSWLFLGVGIVIGGWWAYQELGWGGYWGWDPVENSSLVPWLVATGALHANVMQERRGAFRTWNAILVVLAFVLCLFATFVTRSGVIQSVHAFGRSALGWYFAAFILAALALGGWLLYRGRASLRDERELQSLLSRESGFLLAVLLFLGLGLAILLGTVYPTLVELFRGRQVALDASFYNRVFGPLALLLVLTLGVCPTLIWGRSLKERLLERLAPGLSSALLVLLLAWTAGAREAIALVGFGSAAFALGTVLWDLGRTASARRTASPNWGDALRGLWRLDRRRYAAHLVHLGVLVIAVGLVGSSLYKTERHVVLAPGEEVTVSDYTLRYVQPIRGMDPGRQRTGVELQVWHGDDSLGTLTPERNFHWNVNQMVSEVAIRSSWKEDLYIALAALGEDDQATLQVQIELMVSWLWAGGGILLAGALVGLWPANSSRQKEGA